MEIGYLIRQSPFVFLYQSRKFDWYPKLCREHKLFLAQSMLSAEHNEYLGCKPAFKKKGTTSPDG
jgi:hypothetical protein